jgi:hypothetical protein
MTLDLTEEETGALASLRTVIKPIGARAVGKVVNDDRADWREAWALFPAISGAPCSTPRPKKS